LDRDHRIPALARHLEGALGALSAALSPVLLAVRRGLRRPGLAGLQAAGRLLRADRTHLHRLLLRLFPDHPAGAGPGRKDQAAAELDYRIGAAGGHADRRAGAGTRGAGMRGNAMAIARTIFILAVSLAASMMPALAQEQHETPNPPKLKWSFAG